ncbi:MAG TPA: alpha/beta fold hydrolase [Casimicrobiaceae bacterium]|jgi:pimeloyl-ACP methyl ester carboxylesterase
MPLFSRADVELYYECPGDGAPLLLIAGLASDSLSWQPVLAEFGSRYRVVTLDNRGAGRSVPSTVPTTVQAMADDCVSAIAAFDSTNNLARIRVAR